MAHMNIKGSWKFYSLCVVLMLNPRLIFFIHCSFAQQFWDFILDAFGWSTALYQPKAVNQRKAQQF